MRRLIFLCLVCAGLTVAAVPPQGARPAEPFPAPVLSASLFRAAWAYKHDRAWLDSQLQWLERHRFDAVRALGTVGDPAAADYWDGREIDWRWNDYDETIAGVTDLAFDKYGLRVQWTIFADAQKNTPREPDRQALVERFIRMSRGRERKILAFEVANEFWKNGFDGPDGVRQLQAHAARFRQATSIPIAASAHHDDLCPIYQAGAVDFASIHFERGASKARWTPLTEPWRIARQPGRYASCALPAQASNNEPIGPGSTLPAPMTPVQIVMSAVNTYLTGIPVYVFHSGPGVRDDPGYPEGLRPSRLDQLPQAETIFAGFAAMKSYLPADVTKWKSITANDPDFPLVVRGTVECVLGAIQGQRAIVSLSGMSGPIQLTARVEMEMDVRDPLTGQVLHRRTLAKGAALEVVGPAAVVSATLGTREPS